MGKIAEAAVALGYRGSRIIGCSSQGTATLVAGVGWNISDGREQIAPPG